MTFSLGPRAVSAGYRLAAFDRIGSTNAEAMSRARDGERGPMWFVTSEQTAGRGRRHRPWIAPRGNLASSILEVIDVSPAVAATLGFAAGLALEAALQKVSVEASLRAAGSDDMKYSLKWPNDVLAGREKLAGILLESEAVPGGRLVVVVGIRTNVITSPDRGMAQATLNDWIDTLEGAGLLRRYTDEKRVDELPGLMEANPDQAVFVEHV